MPHDCERRRINRIVLINHKLQDMYQKYVSSQGEPRNHRFSIIYIPSFHLHLACLLLLHKTHRQYPNLSQHSVACTHYCLRFQIKPANQLTLVSSLRTWFHYSKLYYNANTSEVDSFWTHCDGTKVQVQGNGMATARANMMTSGIYQQLSSDRDCIMESISEHIHRLIRIHNVCTVNDEMSWNHIYNIIFLDPVTTHRISHSQLIWSQWRRRFPLRRRGGQPFAHIWGQWLAQPVSKWTLGSGKTIVPSGTTLFAPLHRYPAGGRLNAPPSVALGMLEMFPVQRLSHQTAGSTRQVSFWVSERGIGIRYWTRTIMMRTECNPVCRSVEGGVQAIEITMTTARVRMACWAVWKELRMIRQHTMERWNGGILSMGRNMDGKQEVTR
jgi:hypothetical protein